VTHAAHTSTISLRSVLPDPSGVPELHVADLRIDSREIQAGDAFVALAGTRNHGFAHLGDAILRGAKVVLFDPREASVPAAADERITFVPVQNLRGSLGTIAKRVYGDPSSDLQIAGFTGTNGKTTCAWLYALCRDVDAMYVGTLGAGRHDELQSTRHTTQDVLALVRTLAGFKRGGARHVALEVSSHALDQGRIDGVRIPFAAFTNLTRDHLDYHGSMEAYGEAKSKLFSHPGVEQAVINIDDAFGYALARRFESDVEVTRVSVAGTQGDRGRWVAAKSIRCESSGISISGQSYAGKFELFSPLVGSFNAENLLVVLGMLLAAGVSLEHSLAALREVSAPPGRMEVFGRSSGPRVIVDYAHTPDALMKVLAAVRAHTTGVIWCVFGCGGDRDVGKRPLMAQAAESGADRVIVTDDNPRTEDGDRIVAMISEGFTGRVPVEVERDREQAIRSAYRKARPEDVVLVAGKGHENEQIYGTEVRCFSDRQVALDLVREAA